MPLTPKQILTHKDLVKVAYRWVLTQASCGTAAMELSTVSHNGECPDVIGFQSGGRSVLIEVKVSRSDFFNDKKKSFRIHPQLGMGDFRFYCCPTGMIKVNELPQGWGLIYVNERLQAEAIHIPFNKANTIRGTLHQNSFEKDTRSEVAIMYSMLRRLQLMGHVEDIFTKPPPG